MESEKLDDHNCVVGRQINLMKLLVVSAKQKLETTSMLD